MKKLVMLAALAFFGTGCSEPNESQNEQAVQLMQPVMVLAKTPEVTVYKVKDMTSGNRPWIYFTSKGDIR